MLVVAWLAAAWLAVAVGPMFAWLSLLERCRAICHINYSWWVGTGFGVALNSNGSSTVSAGEIGIDRVFWICTLRHQGGGVVHRLPTI